MRTQKEPTTGRSLNIRPAFLLVPTALETVANQTIKSSSVKGQISLPNNPIQNFASVIGEPRSMMLIRWPGIWLQLWR